MVSLSKFVGEDGVDLDCDFGCRLLLHPGMTRGRAMFNIVMVGSLSGRGSGRSLGRAFHRLLVMVRFSGRRDGAIRSVAIPCGLVYLALFLV